MKSYPIRCRISNAADVTRVDVYDLIGSDFFQDGISASDFAATLAPVKGALEVHINSGGGNVFDGVAIAEAIRSHPGRVTTVVDGIAASIASVIAQAGADRVMAPGSMLMIHEAKGFCEGNSADMTKTAEVLSKVSDNIAEQYAKRAGGTADEWRAAMLAESWYTAEEAIASGLADRISEDETAMWPASLDVAAFSSVPGKIAACLRNMAAAPAIVDADGNHGPMSGEHSHAHPAYGSQGSDATHSHRHSHGGDAGDDAKHSHSHGDSSSNQAGTGVVNADSDDDETDDDGKVTCATCKGKGKIRGGHVKCPDCGGSGKVDPDSDAASNRLTRSLLNADDVDNSAWDGSKAMASGAASDDPAAFYKGICAGRRAGDPTTQDAWALPYKYHPGDPPNAAGVKNALARLPQTKGLTNADQARSVLEAAMKKINPDYAADDCLDVGLLAAALDLGLKGAMR